MKLTKKKMNHILNLFISIISILLILILISYYRKEYFTVGSQNVPENIYPTLNELYRDYLKVDFNTIFPSRNRNGGGAHFFKYAYDRFRDKDFTANQFENFHKIYCAVSGSPIQPSEDPMSRTSDLKLKKLSKVGKDIDLTDNDNFVIGKYYRCCTPCICDLMKHSVVTDDKVQITNDDNESVSLYLILIKNPCRYGQDKLPKYEDGTPKAPAFKCVNGKVDQTRVLYLDKITGNSEDSNYLVIGVLYDHPNPSEYDQEDLESDMAKFRCEGRFASNNPPGGMGEIFIKLSKAGLDDPEDPDEYLGYIPGYIP
tara:strand:- start:3318 stop:4256 length:939 start_codon:yes stop_codon:yes gene_type:complete